MNASAGRHPSAVDVRALFGDAGVDADAVESGSEDDVVAIARRAVAERRSVVVAGGDGTVCTASTATSRIAPCRSWC